MTEKQNEKLSGAIKTNPELKNTINVDGSDYNISAVTAEVAKQTQADLELVPSLIDGSANETERGIFDGEEDKIIRYVPSTGGKFTGPVHLDNGYDVEELTVTEVPEAILNLKQIENKVNNLTGAPCWTWDGEALTAVEEKGIYKNVSIIVGKTEDFNSANIRDAIQTDAPYLYICKDEEPDKTKPVSNKILLCLPNADPVEISKGADRLNSTTTDDYFTYDTLQATIESLTDEGIKLASTLYTYTPIGMIKSASQTNPQKIAEKGKTLKDVFNKVFGVQEDTQPIIDTSGVNLKVTAGTVSYGSSSTEYGTAIPTKDITVTFTLNNSAKAQYGYTYGAENTKVTTTNANFKYAITKQNNADIKITLPTGQTASSSMVTAGTYVSASSNILYCDFNGSNQVSIKINLPAGNVTTSSQTRYGQISASVNLGAAICSNGSLTSFLTYLKEAATDNSKLIGGAVSNQAGPYTIAAGRYYNYYLASTNTSFTESITNATKFSTNFVSVKCDIASHIWFLLPPGTSGAKTISYEPFANTWVPAFGGANDKTSGPVDIDLKLNSGTEVTYKGYYTTAKAAAGSNLNYKIE